MPLVVWPAVVPPHPVVELTVNMAPARVAVPLVVGKASHKGVVPASEPVTVNAVLVGALTEIF